MELARLFERTSGKPVDCSILFPVWNGERFLQESLPSVLKQQRVRAEIIISDDCSSDGSVELIKKIVSAYEGEHDIVVLKTSERAEFDHLPRLVPEARSEILIQAHQDDIQYPMRARVLVESLKGRARLVTSVADYLVKGKVRPPSAVDLERVRGYKTFEPFLYGAQDVMIGSRFAMHADLFRLFPAIERTYITGGLDILLPIRAMLIGEVLRIDKPLLTCGLHRERWSEKLWDKTNNDTAVFGYAVRRLVVYERAEQELAQARAAGLVDAARADTMAAWLTKARRRFVTELAETREKLSRQGLDMAWVPKK